MPPFGDNVKWLLRKIKYNVLLNKHTKFSYRLLESCLMFDPTEIINQLIDNCVRPGLFFALSVINNVIGNMAIETESTGKRVNSAHVLHI